MDKEIEEIIKAFFDKMLVFDAEVNVKEIEGAYEISINSQEPGMLIGKNGETMRAIEQILRLLVNKKMEKSINLSLDIAGYKNKRRQEIEDMATSAADSAIRTGRVQLLIPMNAYERRIVHLTLSKRDDIETESVGEEPDRRVMIKTKKKALV
jgi:spoIIIJ-associated protein